MSEPAPVEPAPVEPVVTPISVADANVSYLRDDITQAKTAANAALKEVRHKELGLKYIQSCKELATIQGELDMVILKQAILGAVALLQQYHDDLA